MSRRGRSLRDIAERPFDFAFRFRSIRPAGARQEAIVPGKVEKRAIVAVAGQNTPFGGAKPKELQLR